MSNAAVNFRSDSYLSFPRLAQGSVPEAFTRGQIQSGFSARNTVAALFAQHLQRALIQRTIPITAALRVVPPRTDASEEDPERWDGLG